MFATRYIVATILVVSLLGQFYCVNGSQDAAYSQDQGSSNGSRVVRQDKAVGDDLTSLVTNLLRTIKLTTIMAKLETTIIMEEEKGKDVKKERRIFDLNLKVLFWQGLVYEAPITDVAFQLENSPAILSSLIVNRPHLYAPLRTVARSYPYAIFAMMWLSSLVIYPMGIVIHWGDKKKVIECAYFAGMWFLLGISTASFLFQKRKIRELVKNITELAADENMDDDNQKDLLKNIEWWTHYFIKYFNICVDGSVGVFVIVYTIEYCVPNRILQISGWYPYDEFKSPAFEITLSATAVLVIFSFVIGSAITTMFVASTIYIGVLFKIMAKKFLNIREIAMKRLTDRKRKELKRRGRMFFDGSLPGRKSSGLVIRRVEELALLRPLRDMSLPGFLSENCPDETTRRQDVANENVDEPEYQFVFTDEEIDKEIHVVLTNHVQYHQRLLQTVRDFNSILNIYLGVNFVVNILIYGGTILCINQDDPLSIKEIMIMLSSLEVVMLFFVTNFLADFISEQAASVGEALYTSDWLMATPSFKRSMLIIMTRVNRPLVIKPSGFAPLSMELFGKVSKQAYNMTANLTSLLT